MLHPRNFIIALFVLAGISIIWSVLKLAEPPDSDGFGRDSYGTRYYGYKAFLDVLRELDIPVSRSLVPPSNALNQEITLVIVDPDAWLVTTEPGHLKEIRRWVETGGNLLLAMGSMSEIPSHDYLGDEEITTVFDALDLANVKILLHEEESERRAEARESAVSGEEDSKPNQTIIIVPPNQNQYDYDFTSTESEKFLAETSGTWGELENSLNWLQLPTDFLQVIGAPANEETSATASVSFLGKDDELYRIAAKYPVGDGSITVVSDSRLLRNFLIFQQDNAVMAAHLAAAPGNPVVFDEFYHGLTVRGNPAWLLSRHPYGLLAILLVIASAIWIARAGVRVGPPLRQAVPGRRAINEYVDAMAGMFHRGRCQDYLLHEVRDGVIWSIAKELSLSHRHRNEQHVLAVLKRRDPQRAVKLQKALSEAEVVLNGAVKLSWHAKKAAVTETARKLNECI